METKRKSRWRLAIAAAVVMLLVVASQFLPIREWAGPPEPPEAREPYICTLPAQKPIYSGPSSGLIVWNGTGRGTEFVVINHNVASKGTIVSGELPEVPFLIEPQNSKRIGILYPRDRCVRDGKVIFRLYGIGPTTVVLRWSVARTLREGPID